MLFSANKIVCAITINPVLSANVPISWNIKDESESDVDETQQRNKMK